MRPAGTPAPLPLTQALLAETIATYDRLTGGQWEAHRNAVLQRPDPVACLPRHPLAWALAYLQREIEQPDWSCLRSSPDAVASALLGAFQQFLARWSQHALFEAMAATAAADGFSLHAMAMFGAAKCLADSGNRIVFTAPPPDGHIETFALDQGETKLTVATQRLHRFEWPFEKPFPPATLRAALLDSLAAAQGRVNLRHRGILVLSPGAVSGEFDEPSVDMLKAILHAQGRRHRGVLGVAIILPKVLRTPQRHEIHFGWSFFPVANPQHGAGQVVRVGSQAELDRFRARNDSRQAPDSDAAPAAPAAGQR